MEQFLHKTSPKDNTSHLSKMQFRILKSSIIEMSQTIHQLQWVQQHQHGMALKGAVIQGDEISG